MKKSCYWRSTISFLYNFALTWFEECWFPRFSCSRLIHTSIYALSTGNTHANRFAHTARHQASREHYETIDEYINAWRPVLAMEAATEAVKESDGFVIERVKTVWKSIKDSTRFSISLPKSYCKARQLEFHPGDLVCARVPYSDTNFLSSSEPSQNNKVSSSADITKPFGQRRQL